MKRKFPQEPDTAAYAFIGFGVTAIIGAVVAAWDSGREFGRREAIKKLTDKQKEK